MGRRKNSKTGSCISVLFWIFVLAALVEFLFYAFMVLAALFVACLAVYLALRLIKFFWNYIKSKTENKKTERQRKTSSADRHEAISHAQESPKPFIGKKEKQNKIDIERFAKQCNYILEKEESYRETGYADGYVPRDVEYDFENDKGRSKGNIQ